MTNYTDVKSNKNAKLGDQIPSARHPEKGKKKAQKNLDNHVPLKLPKSKAKNSKENILSARIIPHPRSFLENTIKTRNRSLTVLQIPS